MALGSKRQTRGKLWSRDDFCRFPFAVNEMLNGATSRGFRDSAPNYPEVSCRKSLVPIFQVAIRFHPGHLQPKTLSNSFSALTQQLLIKMGHYF